MDHAQLEKLLVCPLSREPLRWDGEAFVAGGEGSRYPEEAGVFNLLPEEERGEDLGDGGHYDQHPFEYVDWSDDKALDQAVESELKSFLEALPAGAVIADVGCGAGRVSAYLGRLGHSAAMALDYSARSLGILRANVGFPLVQANNMRLPLGDGCLDALISTGVVHHTPDPMASLRENCRVLREGGKMYFRIYRHRNYYHMLHCFVGGPLRLLRRFPLSDRLLVTGLAFGLYRLASRLLKRGRTTHAPHLSAIFEDYFMNPQTHFIPAPTVEKTLRSAGMNFEFFPGRGTTNLYLVRKEKASSL